jgi:glycosyltransferase involved in cell wall biosynthesis
MNQSESLITAAPDRDVSIIICTRDRCDHLRNAVKQIDLVEVPKGWVVELLVVDNGSKDSTREFVASIELKNMPVRYVFEPRKGKGYAYNAGLAAARGKALLFTDDDVKVPRDWIEGMCGAILDGSAGAVQGGVRIAPHLDRPWLKGALRIWVASVEDAQNRPPGLVGANMACGRQCIAITGGFDPRLGPGASGFYDDTAFGWAIERAGQVIAYRPNVTVEHHFSADRLNFSAFLQSARRMAASKAIVLRDLDPDKPKPSIFDLMRQLPGLGARCITQAIRLAVNRQPDAGFLVRYYYYRLWQELRFHKTA